MDNHNYPSNCHYLSEHEMKQQAGLTLIELVVVILLLGVLAATVLPRFMRGTEDAHEAAVAGTGGGFGSAVSLTHAQWVANGLIGAEVDLDGFGNGLVDTNANGWPVSSDDNTGIPNANRCLQVWSGIMQNPPSVATTAGSDYRVTATGGVCIYTYQAQTALSIVYDSSTGNVTVDSVL
jgi:prepilin-type N-terminal cleavage/methylation domain-containing protein